MINAVRPFRIEGATWKQSLDNAWTRVEEAIQATDNSEKFYAFREAMGKGRHLARAYYEYAHGTFDPARAVGWEIARSDRYPELIGTNPFLKVVSILKTQPMRMDFRQVGTEGNDQFEEN